MRQALYSSRVEHRVCALRTIAASMVHLDKPGPDTGVFHTDEVRPRTKPTKVTSRIIALPKNHYKTAPNLAAGFRSLDLSHEAPVRANLVVDGITASQFKITIETWAKSTLHSAGATWIERAANAKQCQVGQFDTHDVDVRPKAAAGASKPINAQPPQENARAIKFARPFKAEPEVVCWLNRIDMESGEDRNWRVRAYADNVSPQGFSAHIDTWSDSVLNGAAMCWIAFPKGKARVACGSFSTGDVRSWSNPKPKNSAWVGFREGAFKNKPTVLVALNMLDMAGNADLRVLVDVDEVSPDGFRWHLDTWDDSTLYTASASWIALGLE